MFTALTAATMGVSLEAAKLHLRVTHSHEDALITAHIQAATAAAEHETGRSLITQQWEMLLERFPLGDINLAKPPVKSIDSISYINAESQSAVVDPGDYQLYMHPTQPRIRGIWPQGTDVVIKFTAGYGAVADVPEPIKQWILTQVGAMYWNREAVSEKPLSAVSYVDRLLDRYRIWNVA